MPPFRFRASAALQLRRREHDEALAALARAQVSLAEARRKVDDVDGALREADSRYRVALHSPDRSTPLEWYRSWRLRLLSDRQRCETECRTREKEMYDATARATSARQRVRALERLHDNALAAWTRAARREEQKTMDALATIRFTSAQRVLR
jgi:flagellar export protein FliJ